MVSMDPYNSYSSQHILTETVDGVTYCGRWFVDNQVVVLYVGSAGPLTKMVFRDSPDIAAHQLFHEFLADEVIKRRLQRTTELDAQGGKQQAERVIGVDHPKPDGC